MGCIAQATSKPRRACVDTALALMKSPSGWSRSLNRAASTRDHLLRVRSSTLAGSDVHKMIAADGSGSLPKEYPRRRNARQARSPAYALAEMFITKYDVRRRTVNVQWAATRSSRPPRRSA